MKNIKKVLSFMLVLTLGVIITACSSRGNSAEDPIVIYDGDISEKKIDALNG